MAAFSDYGVRRENIIWWLADYVLIHHRAPASPDIIARWNVSRCSAWRYHRMASERLDMLQAREGVNHDAT